MNRFYLTARIVALGILIGLVGTVSAVMGQAGEEGLSALMQRNRDHFTNLVQTAFFESVHKPLSKIDFQRIRQESEAIADIARQARESYSRGEDFDEIAEELEEHAKEAASAAAEQNLPEVNVQIGEMAEYCAKCHNRFRWQKGERT